MTFEIAQKYRLVSVLVSLSQPTLIKKKVSQFELKSRSKFYQLFDVYTLAQSPLPTILYAIVSLSQLLHLLQQNNPTYHSSRFTPIGHV